MPNLNKVMLIGHVTRDVDLKYLPSQTAVAEFGLAINNKWTGKDGVQKEEATFVDCSAFGKQAETLSKYVKKGNPLFVEGHLKLDQWEAQDGTKRSKMRVVVESFQFLARGEGKQEPAGEYQGEQQAPPPEQRPAPRPPARPRPIQASNEAVLNLEGEPPPF